MKEHVIIIKKLVLVTIQDNLIHGSFPQKVLVKIQTGAFPNIEQQHLENNKPGLNNQLRTSRKFKITNIKNTNILSGKTNNGVSIKAQVNPEPPLFEIGNGSRRNIRQSYDNSQK